MEPIDTFVCFFLIEENQERRDEECRPMRPGESLYCLSNFVTLIWLPEWASGSYGGGSSGSEVVASSVLGSGWMEERQ